MLDLRATASHLDSTHLAHCCEVRRGSANSYVRSQGTRQRSGVPTDSGSVSRNCNWLHRVGDGALRRRSIKLLFAGSAFRVSVSGLVLCLNGGRRAQPGHVVRDRGSPPWLHPRRCAALRFLLSTPSTAGSAMTVIVISTIMLTCIDPARCRSADTIE